jgi:hypothetical protein
MGRDKPSSRLLELVFGHVECTVGDRTSMAEGVLDFGRGGGSENVGNGHRYLGARLDGAIDDGVASATWRWIETGVPFSNFGDSIPSRGSRQRASPLRRGLSLSRFADGSAAG